MYDVSAVRLATRATRGDQPYDDEIDERPWNAEFVRRWVDV